MKFLLVALFALLALAFAATQSPSQVYGFDESEILDTVNVTPDGGIKKIVLRAGNGDKPSSGDKVYAHYDGRLTTGKKFDSSYDRGQPFSFAIGRGQVIKGWDQGFATMSMGEKAVLVIEPDYGYGSRGAGGVIPGGATLYFQVELTGINDKKSEL